jgi:hypothetical protein
MQVGTIPNIASQQLTASAAIWANLAVETKIFASMLILSNLEKRILIECVRTEGGN